MATRFRRASRAAAAQLADGAVEHDRETPVRGDRDRDRGASAVEVAIVFPAILFVMVMAFQFGLIAYSHHVVESAAQEAAVIAASEGTGAGATRGNELLSSIGSITSGAGVATAASSSESVTMVGSATVTSLIPLVPPVTVRGSGTATVERFRPEGS